MDRRTFLAWSGGAAAALLAGCGGDGGGGSTVVPPGELPPGDLSPAQRLVPTGTPAQQVTQYSQAIEALSGSWIGTSQSVDEGLAFLEENAAASRQDLTHETYFRSIYYGLAATRSFYERSINAFLALDDAAFAADTIMAGQSFGGEQELRNPQWSAAMLERWYRCTVVFGGFMRRFQIMGLDAFVETVREQQNPTNRLWAYGLFAYTWNTWVTNHLTQLGISPAPYLLQDTETTTVAEADAELNRLAELVPMLPLGPGYRPAAAATRSSAIGDLDLAAKALETTAKPFAVEIGASAATGLRATTPEDWLKTPTLARQGVEEIVAMDHSRILRQGARNAGKNVVSNVIGAVTEQLFGKVGGTLARCGFEIADAAFTTARFAGATVLASASIFGGAAFAGLTILSAVDLANKIINCNGELEQLTLGSELAALQEINKVGPAPPETEPVRVPDPPANIECDQVGTYYRWWLTQGLGDEFTAAVQGGRLQHTAVSRPSSDTGAAPPDPSRARQVACGLFAGTVGRSSRAPEIPRTYGNVQDALHALLVDFLYREGNQRYLGPVQLPDRTEFYRAGFATLVRREAGATEGPLPAVPDGQLMCTAPGYAPKRNTEPMDLGEMEAFPTLPPADQFGQGVNIDVS